MAEEKKNYPIRVTIVQPTTQKENKARRQRV